MTRGKRIFLWCGGVLCVLIILLLALVFLTPKIVNVPALKEKIAANVSQRLEGKVEFRKISIYFFPRPRAILHRAKFALDENIEGTIGSLKVYPKLLPLLASDVRIAKMHAESPDFSIRIPEVREELSFEDMEKKFSDLINKLATKAPGLEIGIKNGKLTIYKKNKASLSFHDIDAEIVLPPREFTFTITGSSENSSSISLSGRLDPKTFKGKGSIELEEFRPHTFIDALFKGRTLRIVDSEANLTITFQTDGFGAVQSEVEGSIPTLVIQRKDKRATIKCKNIRGSFDIKRDRTQISVKKLALKYPQLILSGMFQIDKTSPHIDIKGEGKEVDVNAVRDTLITLAEDAPAISNIFGYVRGGKVPLISFHTQGASFDELGKAEHIFIRGRMEGGDVFIPGPDLDFTAVKGDGVISKGILEGDQIYAHLGNASLREGKLKVGLVGDDAPLHINAFAKVDLAELPPLLKRLIKNETFLREVDLFSDVKGTAQGSLVMGETMKSLKVSFDVAETKLSANYKRIPYLVEIKGGQVSYDDTKIDVKNVSGILGKSSFTELTGTLRLGKPHNFDIVFGKSSFVLEEMYPWLMSYKEIKSALKDILSLQGTILVSSMSLNGQLLNPEKWGFLLAGALDNFTMSSSFLPGPLSLTIRSFQATPEQLSFSDARTSMLDTSLTISGFLKGNFKDLQKADATLKGTAGPNGIRWIKERIELPQEFRVPRSLSVSEAHLEWGKNGTATFRGSMKVKDGPDITLDMFKRSKELMIKKLFVEDRLSRATLSFNLKEKFIRGTFDGMLTSTTVDKLISLPQFKEGWVKGNLQADLFLEKPVRFSAQGTLDGERILIPWKPEVPITIERLSLDAGSEGIHTEANSLRWGETILSLKGVLNSTKEGIVLDMDVFADRLEWGEISGLLGEQSKERKWESPFQGTVRLTSQTFIIDRLAVSPLYAHITLSNNTAKVLITKADVCTVPASGTLNLSRDDVQLNLKLAAYGKDVEHFYTCLTGKGPVTGRYDLKGELTAHGKRNALIRSLNGHLEFRAKDGRIYGYGTLAKIFAFLNVTEIFRGRLPDIAREGFGYRGIVIKGDVQDGKFLLKEAVIDGSSMNIVGEGDIDVFERKMNLIVLVAPLKTIDFIVSKIPVISYILGRKVVSIPVKVTGDLDNPEVSYLPVASVGSGLLGILERTITLPVKMIEPLIPNEKKKGSDSQSPEPVR